MGSSLYFNNVMFITVLNMHAKTGSSCSILVIRNLKYLWESRRAICLLFITSFIHNIMPVSHVVNIPSLPYPSTLWSSQECYVDISSRQTIFSLGREEVKRYSLLSET